ncbi:MAG: ATP-dependent DNA helicase RecQ [Saprospiraceae bacterium]|nr:RecQ family ATP-dependent DNA helicase [Saprospiraceae bacterium]MDW8230063.1 ATP-dependent DNA helicase RecQ [Saprospiraceae bacterium]
MATPLSILQQYWKYPAFRPLQEDIIQSVLSGCDTLALLPTGGGKSICYQVPALCREGVCIVVSPLIALMKDQVFQLKKRGIPAAAIYSGMSAREIDITFENACHDAYKLLYLSPERLQTDMAMARIARMNVNLLAVDEAHCVSQWGYDFRPPYLQIAEFRQHILPQTPLLALTATATPEVVRDIQDKLGFRSGSRVFQQSFERKNLSYSVLYEARKLDKLLSILKSVSGSGLIYVRSRKETKEIALLLQREGISADFYHAGLGLEERNQKQESWLQGRTRIMACTNAFGMGIDKPDVRLVVHLAPPDSLEAYFQEAGRAGRDGLKSYAVLLYTPSDADSLRRHLKQAHPGIEEVRRVYQALGSYSQIAIGAGRGESFPFDLQHFCVTYRFEQPAAYAALRTLEHEGWIALSDATGALPRVRIEANREALYDYQLRQPLADKVIQALLRLYPGIQREYMEVSLPTLARYAKTEVPALEQVLLAARQASILDYQPASAQPTMTFLQERVPPENLALDAKRLQFLRERAEQRIEAVIRYAETRHCRSRQLLAYLGEFGAKPCGICDICTGRNTAELSADAYEVLKSQIFTLLRQRQQSVQMLLNAFPSRQQPLVLQTLEHLLAEGMLAEAEDGSLCLL